MDFDVVRATVLALIQGFTEFLPISSSAHLILPSQLLGWEDQGLGFDMALHLGSLVAVLFYFRRDLVQVSRAMLVQVGILSSRQSRYWSRDCCFRTWRKPHCAA